VVGGDPTWSPFVRKQDEKSSRSFLSIVTPEKAGVHGGQKTPAATPFSPDPKMGRKINGVVADLFCSTRAAKRYSPMRSSPTRPRRAAEYSPVLRASARQNPVDMFACRSYTAFWPERRLGRRCLTSWIGTFAAPATASRCGTEWRLPGMGKPEVIEGARNDACCRRYPPRVNFLYKGFVFHLGRKGKRG
jgi:hypothetical protein